MGGKSNKPESKAAEEKKKAQEPPKVKLNTIQRLDKKTIDSRKLVKSASIKIEINDKGLKDSFKDQLVNYKNSHILNLEINIFFNSHLDEKSVLFHNVNPFLEYLNEIFLSVETVTLVLPDYQNLITKSKFTQESLSEEEELIYEGFLEFVSYNLLFLQTYARFENTMIFKINFCNNYLFFSNNYYLERHFTNGLFLKKSIFNVNRHDFQLFDNFPPNYWELFINLFNGTICNGDKLCLRMKDIINKNIDMFQYISDYKCVDSKKDFFILPRILIDLSEFSEYVDFNQAVQNPDNNIGNAIKYFELVQKKFPYAVANVVYNYKNEDKLKEEIVSEFLVRSFKGFKGLLMFMSKETNETPIPDFFNKNKAFRNFIHIPFEVVRIINMDGNGELLHDYKRSFELLVDLIIMFKVSKTSKVKSPIIKRSTILLIRNHIF